MPCFLQARAPGCRGWLLGFVRPDTSATPGAQDNVGQVSSCPERKIIGKTARPPLTSYSLSSLPGTIVKWLDYTCWSDSWSFDAGLFSVLALSNRELCIYFTCTFNSKPKGCCLYHIVLSTKTIKFVCLLQLGVYCRMVRAGFQRCNGVSSFGMRRTDDAAETAGDARDEQAHSNGLLDWIKVVYLGINVM